MKVTVLGSGTSHGVPIIGCTCSVCRSSNPKNRRNRPCLLVTAPQGANIIVDTPPEFRLIAIHLPLYRVDAVIYTHSHADHIFGLDDLRAFNFIQRCAIPIFAQEDVIADLQRVFEYCFVPIQAGGGKPALSLHTVGADVPVTLHGVTILPLRVMHGRLPILAYKFGLRFAYVTDVSQIESGTLEQLKGLDVLLLDAVRYEPHATHFHLARALDVIEQLKPKQSYLVHLSHDYDHDVTNESLPDGVQLAYDGLSFDVG